MQAVNNTDFLVYSNGDGSLDLQFTELQKHPQTKLRITRVDPRALLPSFMAIYNIGQNFFGVAKETYQHACNFTDQEIVQYHQEGILNRMIFGRLVGNTRIYESIFEVALKELGIMDIETRVKVYNSIRLIPTHLPEGSKKIAKASPTNFAVLLSDTGEVIINLNVVVNKSQKVMKSGINVTTQKPVIIAKPRLKNDKETPKKAEENREGSLRDWFKEMIMWKHFRKLHSEGNFSDQIIFPRAFVKSAKYTFAILDKLPYTLKDYVCKKPTLSQFERTRLSYEVVKVVHYVHTQLEFFHHDIKLSNFLCDSNGKVFLIDWGFATPYRIQAYAGYFPHTKGNLPPEGLSQGFLTQRSPNPITINNELWDSWCVAIVLDEIAKGEISKFKAFQIKNNFLQSYVEMKVADSKRMPKANTFQYIQRKLQAFEEKDRWTIKDAMPKVEAIYQKLNLVAKPLVSNTSPVSTPQGLPQASISDPQKKTETAKLARRISGDAAEDDIPAEKRQRVRKIANEKIPKKNKKTDN